MVLDTDLTVACSLYVLFGTIQVLLTFMLVRNFYGSKKGKRLSSPIRRTAFLFAISCCLRMIFLIIHYIGLAAHRVTYSSTLKNGDETYDLIISDWAGITTDIFLLIAKFMLYLHLITRLKLTYKHSAYYPRKILRVLNVFMFIIMTVIFAVSIFFIFYMFDQIPIIVNDDQRIIFLIGVMCILMLSDFVISSLILYAFSNGLYQLIISLKHTIRMEKVPQSIQQACDDLYDGQNDEEVVSKSKPSHHSRSSAYSLSDISVFGGIEFWDVREAKSALKEFSKEMNENQEKLIKTITKNTLLSSIAIGSTFLFLVFRIFILVLDENDLIALVYSILGAVDSTLDLCVIYLNFSFAKDWYARLCNVFHRCCEECCRYTAERRVYKAYKEETIYDDCYHAL